MGVLVYFFNFLTIENWYKLMIQIPVGIVLYVFGSKIFKLESYEYIKEILKNKLTKREER